MKNDEKLKQILQDKIASKEFAFDEKEWEKAASIIDANRKGGQISGTYYLMTGAMLLLLSFLFNSFADDFKINLKAQEQIKPIHKNSERILMAEMIGPMAASTDSDHASEIKYQTSNQKLQNAPETNNVVIAEKKSIAKTDLNTRPAASVKENKIESKKEQAPEKTITKEETVFTPTEIVNATNNTTPINTNISANSNPTKTETDPVLSFVNTAAEENTKEQTTEVLAATVIPVKEIEITSASQEQVAVIEAVNLPLTPEEIKSLASSMMPPDTALKNLTAAPTIHNILNFEIGTAYLFGWKNSGSKDANGFNPVIGINYLTNVHQKYWFSLGLQYTSVRNLSASSKTAKTTHYSLGEENEVTTITPNTIHYLSFPLKLQYQLNEKNSFGFAYTANYMFNTESTVETYTQKTHGIENYQKYSSPGYTEGFKLFSSQVGAFYRRQLFKDLWINAEFVYGITDIKENSFFNSNNFERNSGIKLTLSYNLFKH